MPNNRTGSETEAHAQKLAAVFRAAPIGIGVVSNRVINDVNDRLIELVGYTRDELIGKSARMLYPSDEEYEYVGREKYRQIAEAGTGAVETRWVRKDGAIIDVLLSSTPIDPAAHGRGVVFTALDITAQKRDREAVAASEKRFREYFESAPVGVFVVDANGMCIDANPAGAAILCFTRDEVIGRTVAISFPPDFATEGLALFEALKTQGEAVVDVPIQRKDGTTIQAHIDARRLDENRFIGFLEDVTERVRLEKDLGVAQETFAKVFDNTIDIITITEFGTGVLIDANAGLERLARRPKKDLLGKTPVELGLWFDAEDFEKFRAILHRDGRVTDYEARFQTTGGAEVVASVSSERKEIAGRDRVVTIVRNITERRRVEKALADSEARLGLFFESSPIGAYLANTEGRYVNVNPAGCRQLGYPRDEILTMSIMDLVEPASLDAAREHFERVVRDGHATGDFAIKHSDGRILNIRVDAVRLADNSILAFGTDLTDREYLENELRETRDRFRKVFENTMDAIAITIIGSGQILAVNAGFERQSGYSRSELIGRTHEELGLWARPEQLPPMRAAMIEHGRVADAEVDFRSRDGRIMIGSVSAQMMEFYGHPCALIVIRDITERKRIEMELAQSEHRFRQLFDEMRTGFALHEIICDSDGRPVDYRWLMVNPAFERLTGLHAEDIVGRRVLEVLPDTESYWIETYGRVALTGAPEDLISHSSELGKWYEVRAYAPSPGLFAVLFHDVTERHESEDIDSAIHEMSVGIAAAHDLDHALEVCMKASLDIAEADAGAILLLNTTGALETVIHHGLPPDFVEKLRVLGPDTDHTRLTMAGKPIFTTHAKLTQHWAATHLPKGVFRAMAVVPLIHEEAVVGCLTVASFSRDDFAQRRQDALVGAASQIAQTVARWRAENERSQLEEQLRVAAKMEAIGRLAGGVAHDFNNILTSISGYTDLLLKSVLADDPMADDLREIAKAANRAASLTQQLLAFSRKQIIEPRVIDLNAAIENSARMLKRMIGEDIELTFVPGAHLESIKADPVQMEQVLINLAVNARDAMPDGGRISIMTANALVDREYASRNPDSSPGEYAMVSVRDTGVGMSDEVRERVFEPFFTTKEQGKGTGLGLSTVYGIARQNGGFVTVDSRPGEGAEFRLYLPAVRELPGRAKGQDKRPESRGAETILVVEDEDSVRRLAKRVLERMGYRVLEASSGDEALAMEAGETIDMVLTDVVMPRMNGRRLVELLALRRPGLKVLFMSGYTEDAIAQHGVLEGGTAFLQKPFAASDLAEKVREVLDR